MSFFFFNTIAILDQYLDTYAFSACGCIAPGAVQIQNRSKRQMNKQSISDFFFPRVMQLKTDVSKYFKPHLYTEP